MSEIKYLSDGRKVLVVGKLNNVESIVQEIFVTEAGDEIPSGEKFTTKSLHDAPVESYAVREEKKLKERIDALKQAVKEAERAAEISHSSLAAKKDYVKGCLAAISALNPDAVDMVVNMVTGEYKYLVISEWRLNAPIPIHEALMETSEYRRYEGLKLLSLFGGSNGDLKYKLHRYSDGSGGSEHVWPCKTWDEAIGKLREHAIERFNANRLDWEDVRKCAEIGVPLPQNIADHFAQLHSSYMSDITASADEVRQKSLADGSLKHKSHAETMQKLTVLP